MNLKFRLSLMNLKFRLSLMKLRHLVHPQLLELRLYLKYLKILMSLQLPEHL